MRTDHVTQIMWYRLSNGSCDTKVTWNHIRKSVFEMCEIVRKLLKLKFCRSIWLQNYIILTKLKFSKFLIIQVNVMSPKSERWHEFWWQNFGRILSKGGVSTVFLKLSGLDKNLLDQKLGWQSANRWTVTWLVHCWPQSRDDFQFSESLYLH